jgi:hypothetical protein
MLSGLKLLLPALGARDAKIVMLKSLCWLPTP